MRTKLIKMRTQLPCDEHFVISLEKRHNVIKVITVANAVLATINKVFNEYNERNMLSKDVKPQYCKYDKYEFITETEYNVILKDLENEGLLSMNDNIFPLVKERAKKISITIKMPDMVATIVSSEDAHLIADYHVLYKKYNYIHNTVFPIIFDNGDRLQKKHMTELNKIYMSLKNGW